MFADNADAAVEICNAAEKALAFLAPFNLTPKRTITFKIVEEKIDSHGYIAYGCYDSRSDVIQLMSYPSILANSSNPRMYGDAFDRVHYAGAIAHELTHAVVQHNLTAPAVGIAPQEYLAHATQLAVLPEERRKTIIQAMEVGAWESGDVISGVYMALEPGKFAVKSYLHLTTMTESTLR